MRYTRVLMLFVFMLALAACDSDNPVPTDGVPSAMPGLTQGPTEIVEAPTPTSPPTETPVPQIKKGDEVTALEALAQLKAEALDWQKDAIFIMLANVKPGQESRLLGMALSDTDLTNPTPGGKGRNWVLLTASRSVEGVVVFDLDGEHIDLVASGKVPASLLIQFTGPGITGVEMSDIAISELMDSDRIEMDAGDTGALPGTSMALISPARLGIASLFTRPGEQPTPELMYEMFSPAPSPEVSFYDALTGARVRQVNAGQ